LALPAFICAVCSGPVALLFAQLAAANHLPEPTKERLGLLALVAVLGGSLVFSCIARLMLSSGASARLRRLANISIVLPIAWAAAIAALTLYALIRLDDP
jgi:hypothetical protein